ncbi:efflux RND transporter periplasmic adaptor subunit (plasmid) [Roseomonas gilardii subsp. gilardii]|uniref:efflux RND transporter periplasmic adaptor subunit n=1 Tax=Roseomonas gilardii TaxID=257708 RepID=UPI001FF83E91|nr:efflux RND transporter periplasmic adaptor subunit [Roseomonas gilardii]UPG74757.1 efflux RND transporter periplasmic adaptor subunit [Roseomonas gilardii subsp. gilardii]
MPQAPGPATMARLLRQGMALAGLLTLFACGPAEPPAPEPPRPVRATNAMLQPGGETVTLTGQVEAAEEVGLAFRIGGRMIERNVNIGDRVHAGQVIARLEDSTPRDNLRAARAATAAARAQLVQARNHYDRQNQLLRSGFTTRANYDDAVRRLQAAQSHLDASLAQENIAETTLAYTDLVADSNGVVTARGAEPGEVVAAGQRIVTLARDGGRDAVFDVPARLMEQAEPDPLVTVSLSSNPSVRASGRVREISPQADPVTRTFRVRVGLIDPPEAMRLGSTVNGSIQIGGVSGIEVPASALARADQGPAVWVVNKADSTVSLRPVEVARYDAARVIISSGLQEGDMVVTAGVQTLRPGQKVRVLDAGQPASQGTGGDSAR